MTAPRAVPSEALVDDGRRVPYRRWRRWVRSLRRRAVLARAVESGADPHDRVYLVYGVVLLALVYGPMAWSALAQAGRLVPGLRDLADAGPAWVAAAAGPLAVLLAVAAASMAGLVAARAGGPLWVSPAEATFVLAGQFGVRDVLWRRAALLVAGAAAVGAFVGTAVAHGAGAAPGPTAAWGAGAALLAQVPLAVGVVAQTAGGRFDVDAAAAGFRRTATAGAGLVGGDSGAVADVLGPQAYAGRTATLPRGLVRRAPVVARDVLGLRRRPGALVGSVVVGCAGALLVAAGAGIAGGGAGPLATVAGACLLYGAGATWCAGLRAMAAQAEPGALLPGSVHRVLAGHAVVPVLVALVVVAAALLVSTAVGAAAATAVPVAAVLAVVLAARLWVAGATAAPPGLFTPMMTPNGDASMLVLGAWYLRGWLVVAGTAWLAQRLGGDGAAAVVVALLVAAWLVTAGLRRFGRA